MHHLSIASTNTVHHTFPQFPCRMRILVVNLCFPRSFIYLPLVLPSTSSLFFPFCALLQFPLPVISLEPRVRNFLHFLSFVVFLLQYPQHPYFTCLFHCFCLSLEVAVFLKCKIIFNVDPVSYLIIKHYFILF